MSTRTEEDFEVETTELVAIPSGDPMIDMQVATAKRYPRSVARFRKEATELALLDEETAAECFYALPRGGKKIEGPSARLAEILVYAWGNCRADAEVVEVGEKTLKARGTFFDLERNVAVRKTVERRITDANGRRYNDDMIGVTGNAANSIAFRNAVFGGIPKALWKRIYEQARVVSVGKGGTLTQTRQKLMEWFGKLGITAEQIYELLDVEGLEDLGEDEVIQLRGLSNAIKDGDTTVEEAFSRTGVRQTSEGTNDLNERIRAKKKGGAPAAATTDEEKEALAQKAAEKRAQVEKEKLDAQLVELWTLLARDAVSEDDRSEALEQVFGDVDWIGEALELLAEGEPIPVKYPPVVADMATLEGLVAGLRATGQQQPKSRKRAAAAQEVE